jgi:hypothetical protein
MPSSGFPQIASFERWRLPCRSRFLPACKGPAGFIFVLLLLSAPAMAQTSCAQLDSLRPLQHMFTAAQVAQAHAWYARNCSSGSDRIRSAPRKKKARK